MFRTRSILGLPALALLLLAGCGSSTATYTGEVTFEGQPVGNGYITFTPKDGKGPTTGGEIKDGRYTVANVTPGPKVVKIEAVKPINFAASSAELEKKAAEARTRGDHSGLVDPADIIPPNAEGNNAEVDAQPGKHTRDFHLKKPTKK